MTKDDSTWLNICYVVGALLLMYVAWKAFNSIGIYSGLADDYSDWFSQAVGFISVIAGVFIVYQVKSNREKHDYYLASIGELRKVTWPTWIDTKKMTIIVVIVVGIFSVVLAVFDLGFAWLLQTIIS